MEELTQDNFHNWIIQLWYGEFVLWGYGPKDKKRGYVVHIDRDHVHYVVSKMAFEMFFDFELPDHTDRGLPPSAEYERKVCWGWRFFHPDTLTPLNWHVSDSKEQAVAEGREKAVEKRNDFLNIVDVQVLQDEAGYEINKDKE